MKNVFENLKDLKSDMEKKGWCIDSFVFKYKEEEYIVLIKLYGESENKPKYALVKMEFISEDNRSIIIPTNSNGFMTELVSIVDIRHFFGIEYQINLGNFINQFHSYLARFIPRKVLSEKSEREKECMVSSLSRSDGETEDKIYCYKIRRNPVVNGRQQRRSIYNDNKTRIIRPELYEEYRIDSTISFCYSADRKNEKSNMEIRLNFAKNNA